MSAELKSNITCGCSHNHDITESNDKNELQWAENFSCRVFCGFINIRLIPIFFDFVVKFIHEIICLKCNSTNILY